MEGFIYDMKVSGFRCPYFEVFICVPEKKIHLHRTRVVFDTVDERWNLLGACDNKSCLHLFTGKGKIHKSRRLSIPQAVIKALKGLKGAKDGTKILSKVRLRDVFINGPEGSNQNRRWIQNI